MPRLHLLSTPRLVSYLIVGGGEESAGSSHWSSRGGAGGHRKGKRGSADRDGGGGSSRGSRGRGRGRPPPGLTGREIGMWYRDQGLAKRAENDIKTRVEVNMDSRVEKRLQTIIRDIKTAESVPKQDYLGMPPPPRDSDSSEDDWWNNDSTTPPNERKQRLVRTETQTRANASMEDDSHSDDEDLGEFVDFYQLRSEDLSIYDKESIDISHIETVQKNPKLDEKLKVEFELKRSEDRGYQRMQKVRSKLPSFQMAEDVLSTVRENQVTVISGETGCGKTTQVSQFILDDFIKRGEGSLCKVICTQPRRISAISVAERVADERSESCGDGGSVGYQIRLDCKLPRQNGSILYCTTGIVLQWLQSDPLLKRVSHIILDEIHERDLQSDFLMIILKDLLPLRPKLKLILMSATLNAEKFSRYFGDCPMLNIPGFTHPVKEYMLEDVIQMINYVPSEKKTRQSKLRGTREEKQKQILEMEKYHHWIDSLRGSNYSAQTVEVLHRLDISLQDDMIPIIVDLVEHICRTEQEGAILVFLPGWTDISKTNDMLTSRALFRTGLFRIIPLHSQMPTINQREVFERPPLGVRKIVIATNIAETSITIDDVVFVVDCGKIKLKQYDAERNITTLLPEWNSLANSKQRRGRAGRVQPGVCYHLYTTFQGRKLEPYQLPEMLRTRLEELCLNIKLLKLGRILPFVQKAMEPPSLQALENSVELLKQLNALNHEENLTSLGHHLARMPVDPQIGKMILFGAIFSCLEPILTIAASLSFKDPFFTPLGKEKEADQAKRKLANGSMSDHILLVNAFKQWERAKFEGRARNFCWDHYMSSSTLEMLKKMKRQFADLLQELGFIESNHSQANVFSGNTKLVEAIVAAGLYPNVAKIYVKENHSGKQHFKHGKTASDRPPALFGSKNERMKLHPKSINSNANSSQYKHQWMVYHLKMKTTNIFIFDCTPIAPYPLLFFGGAITMLREGNVQCVAVDDWIKFNASSKTVNLVKDLRHQFELVLEQKVLKPGATDWDPCSKEGAVIRAIMDLITTD
ncbi:ATP-dependent DNA/RNA helicase DHX36-like isoform X2 [Tubulanus polymorphus]|uniref:ATP-dependent DNA/RNA helicase DHX36-like isoform X2 n=1 Tax=Tubulanus polymorphus TaxID=672921 RepID=UPI003DA54601